MIPIRLFILSIIFTTTLCPKLSAKQKELDSFTSKINSLTNSYYESTNKNPAASLKYAKEAFSYYGHIKPSNVKFTVASNYATSLYINGEYNQAISILDTIDYGELEIGQKALYFTIKGLIENDLNNFTIAENDFSQALQIYRQLNDKDNEFAILNNLGLLYNNIGDYKTSLEYYLSCYDIIHDLRIKVDRYKYYMNIGTVNFNLNNFEASLESFNEALKEASHNSDSLRIFNSHEKIGHTHASLNNLKEAVDNYNYALQGYKELNLNKDTSNLLLSLGDIYGLTGRKSQQYKSYIRAFELAERYDYDQTSYLATFKLARYFQEEDLQKAKRFYEKIIDSKSVIINQEIIRDAYSALYNIEKVSNPLMALEYLEQFLTVETNIKERNALSQSEQIEAKFNLQKKDYELKNLRDNYRLNELELENKDQKIKTLIGFTVLTTILLLLILTTLIQKRKAQKILAEKNERINSQNKKLIQTNTEIKNRRKELTEINKVKSQLLSVIAHDVKSPMTDLYNLLFILRNNMGIMSKQELTKNLAIIESSTSNILNLLNNILNWVITQSSGFKIKTSSFSLNDLIKDNLNLIESSRVAKDLNITYIENDHIEQITSDRNIVDFALRNLLSNAVKFTEDNGEITIKVTEEHENIVSIKIEDSGIGFNKKTHKLIKSNEERVPPALGTNSEKGYGIGLSLGKKMLAKINSKIIYQKNEPTGSIFTLQIKSLK